MELQHNTIVNIPEAVMENAVFLNDPANNRVGIRTRMCDWATYAKKHKKGARTNPIAPNQADIVNWKLYDSYSVAQAASFPANIKLFVTPIGQNSKTKINTNLEQVQRLPDPQWMNVTHIGYGFNQDIYTSDIKNVLNTYYQEFWVGQKIYSEGPLFGFPNGAGVVAGGAYGTTVAATTVNSTTNTNGFQSVSNMYDLRLPAGIDLGGVVTDGLVGIQILQGQNFKVELNGTAFTAAATAAGGVGITVWGFLEGILSRGVQ